MHQKLTGQCTMRVSDFLIYPTYHMKSVYSSTFTQMVLQLISNSVHLQAAWFQKDHYIAVWIFSVPLPPEF